MACNSSGELSAAVVSASGDASTIGTPSLWLNIRLKKRVLLSSTCSAPDFKLYMVRCKGWAPTIDERPQESSKGMLHTSHRKKSILLLQRAKVNTSLVFSTTRSRSATGVAAKGSVSAGGTSPGGVATNTSMAESGTATKGCRLRPPPPSEASVPKVHVAPLAVATAPSAATSAQRVVALRGRGPETSAAKKTSGPGSTQKRPCTLNSTRRNRPTQ
mmetsp:Transcript_129393/g.414741  ORF Transcript_129393/g.414741 Transcript_129393/m.414741 type:complete len:216 (+) Transcript_129393:192-839(+)